MFWGDKSEGSEFKSVIVVSGSCGVGSCEAASQLHGTARLFSRFLSGAVRSVSKKRFLHTYFTYRVLVCSLLGHVYSDTSVFPMISCIPGSSQMCVDNLLRFRVDLLSRLKTTPFQPLISSWGIGKSRRGRGQTNKGWGSTVMFLEVRDCRETSDV